MTQDNKVRSVELPTILVKKLLETQNELIGRANTLVEGFATTLVLQEGEYIMLSSDLKTLEIFRK